MNLIKSIIKIFFSNFFQLLVSLIIGFMIPVILDLNEYAELKTYTLYLTYIGLFHFGFLDGLYLKYGGNKLNKIDMAELKGEHDFLIISQIIITIFLLFIGLLFKSTIIVILALSILPVMIQTFYRLLYQATGEFSKYSKIMFKYSFVYLFLNIVLVFIFKINNFKYYCFITIIAYLISVLNEEISFLKKFKEYKRIIDLNKIATNISKGFIILIANLAVVGVFGIDKWFVKLLFQTEDFAYYSFAVSMFNLINNLINAISITFYNYLFENSNKEKINKLKNILFMIGSYASAGYFLLAYVVNNYVDKYIKSLSIISVSFSIFPYVIFINALIINVYKVKKKERKYFKIVLGMFLVSVLYNIFAVILFDDMYAIAFATLLTFITWTIFSSNDLKEEYLNLDLKSCFYVFITTVLFLITAHLNNYILGGVIYLFVLTAMSIILYKKLIFDILSKFFLHIEKR